MYTLPDDAPAELVRLLERWQAISKRHPPTLLDLPFEDLVGNHPGLVLVEPVRTAKGKADLKHVLVGPQHAAHAGVDLEGQLYSDMLYPSVFKRMMAVYQTVLETGEPHYWQRINGVFGAPPVEFSRLLLPLYDDNGNAACLLGSWVWVDNEVAKSAKAGISPPEGMEAANFHQ